jgi:hypothetical protein
MNSERYTPSLTFYVALVFTMVAVAFVVQAASIELGEDAIEQRLRAAGWAMSSVLLLGGVIRWTGKAALVLRALGTVGLIACTRMLFTFGPLLFLTALLAIPHSSISNLCRGQS